MPSPQAKQSLPMVGNDEQGLIEMELVSEIESESENGGKEDPGLNRISWSQFLRFDDGKPKPKKSKSATTASGRVNTTKPNGIRKRKSNKSYETNNPVTISKRRKVDISIDTPVDEERWKEKFSELKEYISVHGNSLVPWGYSENPELGLWVNTQRKLYKKDLLQIDREQKLQRIGFVWDTRGLVTPTTSTTGRETDTNEKASSQESTCTEDSDSEWENERATTRKSRKNKRKENHRGDTAWNQRYDELKAYLAVHGDCLVPRHNKENVPLGHWVSNQRYLYRTDQLSKDRELKLKQIGFVWKATNSGKPARTHVEDSAEEASIEEGAEEFEAEEEEEEEEEEDEIENRGGSHSGDVAWNQRYDELKAYLAVHGNCLVPFHYKENASLGYWVAQQRYKYKTDKLLKHRELKLKQIGFVWSAPMGGRRNHRATPREGGPSDASEAASSQENSEELESEEEDEIENRGGSNRGDMAWNQRYDELKAYLAVHGDCLVPQRYKENVTLGGWVNNQRWLYMKNKLLKDREVKLRKIGFVWKASRGRKPASTPLELPAEEDAEEEADLHEVVTDEKTELHEDTTKEESRDDVTFAFQAAATVAIANGDETEADDAEDHGNTASPDQEDQLLIESTTTKRSCRIGMPKKHFPCEGH